MKSDDDEMRDGQRVEVRLHGHEPPEWLAGTVIKARKQWVQMDAPGSGVPHVADENSISEWRPERADLSGPERESAYHRG
jgi:hypothetical protein